MGKSCLTCIKLGLVQDLTEVDKGWRVYGCRTPIQTDMEKMRGGQVKRGGIGGQYSWVKVVSANMWKGK